MAEMNLQSHLHGEKGIVRRAKKLSTKVDLTPMVDLGFLLITFFIITTTWSKPVVMKIFLPADGPSTTIGESVSLTMIPLQNDVIFYYNGSLQEAVKNNQWGISNYSSSHGIRDIIRQKQYRLDHDPSVKKGRKDMVVIIKPTPVSNFQNIVKSLDEMVIDNINTYTLTDTDEYEKRFLKERKFLN